MVHYDNNKEEESAKKRLGASRDLLMLDESMHGCHPSTSTLCGLPKCIFEPRKPFRMGTMFNNSTECKSEFIVFNDEEKNPEKQARKAYNKKMCL